MQGQIVFKGKDLHTVVEVIDTPELRHLHFGTRIIQSSMYHRDHYAIEMEYNQMMLLALLLHPNPSKALFLGLGGGSHPKFLWRYFPKFYCHCIEISPLVIETAYRYFYLPKDPRITVECIPAEEYLTHTEETFDLLFIDLYLADRMADAPHQPSFFSLCKKRLKPNGILVWNLWRSTRHELVEGALEELKREFDEVLVLQVVESPNLILIAKDKKLISSKELEQQASELTARTGLDFLTLMRKNLCFELP